MQNDSRQPPVASLTGHLILLASTFLVGLAWGNWLAPQTAMGAFATGAVGLIAYLLLYVLYSHRKKQLREAAARQLRSQLEQRLERHKRHSMPRPAADCAHSFKNSHVQYVPVATQAAHTRR